MCAYVVESVPSGPQTSRFRARVQPPRLHLKRAAQPHVRQGRNDETGRRTGAADSSAAGPPSPALRLGARSGSWGPLKSGPGQPRTSGISGLAGRWHAGLAALRLCRGVVQIWGNSGCARFWGARLLVAHPTGRREFRLPARKNTGALNPLLRASPELGHSRRGALLRYSPRTAAADPQS